MEKCPKCGKRFPSKTEESAMKKKARAVDPEEWEKLRKKISNRVCTCPNPVGSVCTSSEQPPDLRWHDKFDR